jgi:glycerol-3-phosphate dehydrogenase
VACISPAALSRRGGTAVDRYGSGVTWPHRLRAATARAGGLRERRPPGTAPPPGSVPSPFEREAGLSRLGREVFDVVVVGGGITGCGVALDAAARGLRTALVEATDFGAGTSSKSSKLVHGGLRYLQHREYRLVRDALAERQRLLHNAPHLIHPVPFVIPLFGRDRARTRSLARAYSVALWVYDLAGGLRIGRRHRRISATETLRHVPSLRTERLMASFVYWDAQTDDARLTLAVARTAAMAGAVMVNRAPVVAVLAGGAGRQGGVRLEDGTEVRAEVVVNAGGVWSAEIADLAGAGPAAFGLRPAKGVHVTVPASRLPCDHAVVLPVPGEKRSVFVVPWDAREARQAGGAARFTYIGTTDTDYEGPLGRPLCTAEDAAGLLAVVNAWTTADLGPGDVCSSWAGLRPLVSDESDTRTADLSRRHLIASRERLVSITGGKLTTYRAMAADTVDEVVRLLGRPPSPSPTRRLPLVGAGDPNSVARRGGVLGVPGIRSHLTGRYGAEATIVAALADDDPDLAGPLVPGLPYLRAEAVFAVRQEMAGTLLDVLSRRTRALMLDRRATLAAGPAVALLLGRELSWSPARRDAELAALAGVVAEEERALSTSVPAGAVDLPAP